MAEQERDEISGVETTGHEWDGIKELNNPLPRWWLYLFYACILFAFVYAIAYPAWPLINEATPGVIGYSSRADVAEEIEAARQSYAEETAKVAATPIEEIPDDPELFAFAQARGAALFRTHCSTCHGANGGGAVGFPNLRDDDWLWGGSLTEMQYSITHGIRQMGDDGFQTAETRFSQMPAFGVDEILSRREITDVAEYVVSLSGRDHDAEMAERGAEIFAAQCVSCHGVDGTGKRSEGAPNLTDPIWLYGSDRRTLVETIFYSRRGMMPAWGDRLTEADIKEVTIFVHELGGGE